MEQKRDNLRIVSILLFYFMGNFVFILVMNIYKKEI